MLFSKSVVIHLQLTYLNFDLNAEILTYYFNLRIKCGANLKVYVSKISVFCKLRLKFASVVKSSPS